MSIRLDERRYVEELKRLVADFRMWKNPLVPLPDGFEDDLAWRSYRVFGQTSPADIIALAVRTRDEDLVAQGEGFISDSVSMIDDEDVFGWLFRMIWGKELQLRQQIADADVENLDATFDFLTSACRLAAHILLGWGEGDASSAYIARLFLIEQYDEALNCILPYSNVSLNANETELVVSDLRDRAIAAAMRRGETAAMETKLHKAEDGPHYSSGEDSTASDDGEGLDVADDGRPFPQSDVLYLFDADHVIEAYRYFLDHADGDGELDNGNPWRRPDFVQASRAVLGRCCSSASIWGRPASATSSWAWILLPRHVRCVPRRPRHWMPCAPRSASFRRTIPRRSSSGSFASVSNHADSIVVDKGDGMDVVEVR